MTDVLSKAELATPVDDARRPPILAAAAWRTNAELIAAVCDRLGYIRPDDAVLDMTYGRGVWWKKWRPHQLVTNDLNADVPAMFHEDFRSMHFEPATFDAIAFDPPYSAAGGAATSTIPGYLERYGRVPSTPAEIQDQANDGLTEAHRLVRPGGIVLTKCQSYVWSGRLYLGAHHTLAHALDVGFEVCEILQHTGKGRPQPVRHLADGSVAPQRHARQNYSSLYVLRRPK